MPTNAALLERIARASEEQFKETRSLRRQVRELTAWVRRMAIAAMLWGTGAGLTLNAEQIADLLIALLKRGR